MKKINSTSSIVCGTLLVAAISGCDSSGPEKTNMFLTALDSAIENASAFQYIGTIYRTDAPYVNSAGNADFVTDLMAEFTQIVGGTMPEKLTELQETYRQRTYANSCVIEGSYDGLEYSVEQENTTEENGVSAGDSLSVSDDAGALGALEPVNNDQTGPYYEWVVPSELTRNAVGTLRIDVPGDVAPGIGTISIDAAPSIEGITTISPTTTDAVFRWKAGNSSSYMTLLLNAVNESENEQDVIKITCTTEDDGFFTLPNATLAQLPESLNHVTYYLLRSSYSFNSMGDTAVILNSEIQGSPPE